MSYTPPPLSTQVVLQEGYTPPPLSEQVILCPEEPASGGTLYVEIRPPAPPLSARFTEQPARTPPDLWAAARPPNARDVPASASGQGRLVLSGHLAAAILPPAPPVIFRGRERAYIGTLHVTILPPAPPAQASARAEIIQRAVLSTAVLPEPPGVTASGTVRQDLDLTDATGPAARLPYRIRRGLGASRMAMRSAHMLRLDARAIAPHSHGLPAGQGLQCPHADTLHTRRAVAIRHAHGPAHGTSARIRHAEMQRTRRGAVLPHAHGTARHIFSRLPHAEQLRVRPRLAICHAHTLPAAPGLRLGHKPNPHPTIIGLRIRWAHGIPPPPGRWWPTYEPPGLTIVLPCTGGYVPRPLRCQVILGPGYEVQPPCPIDPPAGTIIVPVQEVYYVLNTFALTLVDGQPVLASSFSASLDYESWSWTWSATVPAGFLSLLRPGAAGPREVLATVNGTTLRLTVETLARERRFGRAELRIGGRSRSSELADPRAPSDTRSAAEERTARQLMEDALTENGVPLGWLVDWGLDDWLVPAGAWNHTGTAMDAVTRIAQAAGGYVQPHNTDKTLRILPTYPDAPWNWSALTADIALPEDVATVEGIEWTEQPNYNTVYLAGTGILGHVTRTGTAGDRAAPMVTDELLSDPAATWQRGRAILGNTGRQARIGLTLPVLQETGIILPGNLVDYTEQGTTRRGLTRGVSVQVEFPRITQTIQVETHEPL